MRMGGWMQSRDIHLFRDLSSPYLNTVPQFSGIHPYPRPTDVGVYPRVSGPQPVPGPAKTGLAHSSGPKTVRVTRGSNLPAVSQTRTSDQWWKGVKR
jgi:hypothetical protein